MRRGVITLTKREIQEALRLVEASRESTALFQKLNVVRLKDEDEIKLQTSEEELEILLDSVGIPTKEEPEERKSLRLKVKRYLLAFRRELQ